MRRARSICIALCASLWLASPALAFQCLAPSLARGPGVTDCATLVDGFLGAGVMDPPAFTVRMPGASGGVVFNYLATQNRTDPQNFVPATPATLWHLAQGAYFGRSVQDVRFIGAIGFDPVIIAVSAESAVTTLEDLVAATREDPAFLTYTGLSARRGLDHLTALMLLRRFGLTRLGEVTYLQSSTGGDAVARVRGGFAQAIVSPLSQLDGYMAAGDIRALVVLSDAPPPDSAGIPTAAALGVDLLAGAWLGLYVARDLPDTDLAAWRQRIARLTAHPAWQDRMAETGQVAFPITGPAFETFVADRVRELQNLLQEIED